MAFELTWNVFSKSLKRGLFLGGQKTSTTFLDFKMKEQRKQWLLNKEYSQLVEELPLLVK